MPAWLKKLGYIVTVVGIVSAAITGWGFVSAAVYFVDDIKEVRCWMRCKGEDGLTAQERYIRRMAILDYMIDQKLPDRLDYLEKREKEEHGQ